MFVQRAISDCEYRLAGLGRAPFLASPLLSMDGVYLETFMARLVLVVTVQYGPYQCDGV